VAWHNFSPTETLDIMLTPCLRIHTHTPPPL